MMANQSQIIQEDHKKKSNQVKKMQRKLKSKAKNTVHVDTLIASLQGELNRIRKEPIDMSYWATDVDYAKEVAKKEGEIRSMERMIHALQNRKQ